MKSSIIIFLTSLIIESTTFFDEYYFYNSSESDDKNALLKDMLNLTNHLNVIINFVHLKNDKCKELLTKRYHNNEGALQQLYEGSSKGFIDLNSFLSCVNPENNDTTFYTVYPEPSEESVRQITRLQSNLTQYYWIFGICLKRDICNVEDIKEIFDSANKLFQYTFQKHNKDNIIVFDYYQEEEKIINSSNIARQFVPLLFLLIQIIFMIFKIIPTKIFGFFIRRRYIKESEDSKVAEETLLNNNLINTQISLKIKQCFSVSEIFEDLITSKKNELFKDNDMTYIRGIKTLGIILFIFGFNFFILYNYPLCLIEAGKRKDFLKDNRTLFLIISFRLSPALIISSSGFSLSYKFLNFLDKKLTNISLDLSEKNKKNDQLKNDNENKNNIDNDNKIDKIAEKTEKEQMKDKSVSENNSSEVSGSNDGSKSYFENTVGIKFYTEDINKKDLNKMFQNQRINESLALSEISTDKIPYSMYFNFAFRQIHKVACLGIGISLFKRSFPLILIIFGKGPLVYKLNKDFFENLGKTVGNIFYYGNFVDLFGSNDSILTMNLFCLTMSELNHFIFCSILIFICYKKKLRLDLFIIILIFIFVIFKIVYITTDLENTNPGMFYTDTRYQRFFFNPLFNFDYFLIGMLFGILNYVVQNDMIKKESLTRERPFTKIPIKLSKYCDYQKSKNNFRFILAVIVLLFLLLIVPYLFSFRFENIIMENDPDYFFLIMSLIDIELFTYLFHFVCMASYITGRNLFYRIFNAPISSYGMKLGYWIILGSPTLTYLIAYSNEANINLSFFIVLIYGFITLFNSFIISLFLFVILEMPYKKLIKLYFNISAVLNKVYLEDENDEECKEENGEMPMNELNEKDIEGNNDIDKIKEEDDDEEEEELKH